jgi:GNAT superfamily N-acetyltransferase
MFRAATPTDLEAATALLVANEEHSTGRPSRLGVADVKAWTNRVDFERDSWAFEEDGRMLAFAWHEPHGEVSFGVGVVHPDARGRGLGTELVERVTRRAIDEGAKRLHYSTLAADEGAPALLTGRGFHEVRRFYEMGIELDGAPPEPVLPDGLALETFREEDARAFHQALDEAFRDHWEHRSVPFEEWWERHTTKPDHDPSLWFLVRDGDAIAAASRNEPNRNGGGWVDALAVRRPWRGKGVAKALLLHTFGEFHRRGVNRVSLGVDAQNPTGATKLYESVGMKPELEMVTFEKALA